MSEQDKSLVELHSISANVMDVLLDFVYTETVDVTVENVQELLPAACLLQLTGDLTLTRILMHGLRLFITFISHIFANFTLWAQYIEFTLWMGLLEKYPALICSVCC